jgi:hypothetical protein
MAQAMRAEEGGRRKGAAGGGYPGGGSRVAAGGLLRAAPSAVAPHTCSVWGGARLWAELAAGPKRKGPRRSVPGRERGSGRKGAAAGWQENEGPRRLLGPGQGRDEIGRPGGRRWQGGGGRPGRGARLLPPAARGAPAGAAAAAGRGGWGVEGPAGEQRAPEQGGRQVLSWLPRAGCGGRRYARPWRAQNGCGGRGAGVGAKAAFQG